MVEQKDAIDIAAEQCMARIQAAISESQPVSAADAAWMWKTIEYQRRELDIHECADDLRASVNAEWSELRKLSGISVCDDSPITRDVCRKLGMQEVPPGCWRKSWAVVFFQLGEEQAYLVQILDVDFREVTAGQLALLVANPPMR